MERNKKFSSIANSKRRLKHTCKSSSWGHSSQRVRRDVHAFFRLSARLKLCLGLRASLSIFGGSEGQSARAQAISILWSVPPVGPRTFLPVWSFSYPLLVKSVVTLHRLMDWLELVTRLRIKSVDSFSMSRRAASFHSSDLEQTYLSGLLLVSYEWCAGWNFSSPSLRQFLKSVMPILIQIWAVRVYRM